MTAYDDAAFRERTRRRQVDGRDLMTRSTEAHHVLRRDATAIDNLLRRLVPRSTPAPTTDTSVAFPVGDGSEIRLPVTRIAGGFARGPGGLCAFCAGDACGEDSAPDSPIARFFAANPIAPSCPVCDGRPS